MRASCSRGSRTRRGWTRTRSARRIWSSGTSGGSRRALSPRAALGRVRRGHVCGAVRKELQLRRFLFDGIYLDRRSLISVPYQERWAALERLVPADLLARRIVTGSRAEIEAFLKEALDAGHEGLMAKQLDSTYSVGKRGKKWFKNKPADNLDVAILAA